MDHKKRRILIISALFPPNVIGGAEVSAYNIAQGFRSQGWDVGVLCCAADLDQVCADKIEDGLRVWRIANVRPYPANGYLTAPKYLKPIWHLQDHFDPRNRRLVRPILEAFRPDLVQLHILQGIGYNVIRDIAEIGLPANYFQHDLGLACIRMSMFKNGSNCKGQCLTCALSSRYKLGLLRRIKHLQLISPSEGNFRRMSEVIDISSFTTRVALNPNSYPLPLIKRTTSSLFRVLFAGRIHESKGIQTVVKALSRMAARGMGVELNIAGSGPYEHELRRMARELPFVRFYGFIPQQALSDLMQQCDVMTVPSIWTENSPGVLIHGLSQGLPALGSNLGGIPELITDGRNGFLLPAGDVDAWEGKLTLLAEDRVLLSGLQEQALATAGRFSPQALMSRILDMTDELIDQTSLQPSTGVGQI
jgi:glycosyltransferase involved in cell wall biosynthesis